MIGSELEKLRPRKDKQLLIIIFMKFRCVRNSKVVLALVGGRACHFTDHCYPNGIRYEKSNVEKSDEHADEAGNSAHEENARQQRTTRKLECSKVSENVDNDVGGREEIHVGENVAR